MRTIITYSMVYARVKLIGHSKHRVIKVIKRRMFTVQNGIKHHLICNLYYSLLHNWPLEVIKEIKPCNVKPIIITKFSFRHTPRQYSLKRLLKNRFMHQTKDY